MDSSLAAPWLLVGAGYLLGSVPFGLLVTRFAGEGDLRGIGSGNIGTTNVLRTGRKGLAALTLLLDAGKGVLAVLLAHWIDPESAPLAATGAFIGHLYPVWLALRGGKGVATMLGLTLALSWPVGLAFAVTWLGAMLATRHSSVGGMAAAIVAPLVAALVGRFDLTLLFIAFATLVLWKHRANIERLLDGSEPQLGRG